MDAGRHDFEADCLFYKGDPRPTKIRWFRCMDGAKNYFGPSVFSQDARFEGVDPPEDDQVCGDRAGKIKVMKPSTPPWALGQHVEGDEDDFAGRKSWPQPVGTDCGGPATLTLQATEHTHDDIRPMLLAVYEVASAPEHSDAYFTLTAVEYVPNVIQDFPTFLLSAVEIVPAANVETVTGGTVADGSVILVTPAVTSVYGRTGDVIAQAGDYSVGMVAGAAQTTGPNTFTVGQTIQQPNMGSAPGDGLVLSNPTAPAPGNPQYPPVIAAIGGAALGSPPTSEILTGLLSWQVLDQGGTLVGQWAFGSRLGTGSPTYNITLGKDGTLTAVRLKGAIDAGQISSGVLDPARLPAMQRGLVALDSDPGGTSPIGTAPVVLAELHFTINQAASFYVEANFVANASAEGISVAVSLTLDGVEMPDTAIAFPFPISNSWIHFYGIYSGITNIAAGPHIIQLNGWASAGGTATFARKVIKVFSVGGPVAIPAQEAVTPVPEPPWEPPVTPPRRRRRG